MWGADVAVLELPAAVSVTPKPVLLMPPYGFSPSQDFFGQSLRVVGRGLTEPSITDPTDADFAIMRTGLSGLDAYAQINPQDCQDEPDTQPFVLQLHDDDGTESMTLSEAIREAR